MNETEWAKWREEQGKKYAATSAWRVDRDRFWYLLEVLPPGGWFHSYNVEWFYVIERLTDNIVTWAARIGNEKDGEPLYICFQQPANLPTADIQEIVRKAIEANRAGTLPTSQEEAYAADHKKVPE